MGNINNIQIVLGSLRYKSASNTDLSLQLPLVQTVKENVEFDRSINVDLAEVYNNERQLSTIVRPSCKFSVLFKNSYTGSTNYTPFKNNLYYVNASTTAALQCKSNSNSILWAGFPQYNEFDFIRNDYNVSGYTLPPNNHIDFVAKSASTYNWNFYMSYPYGNNYSKKMSGYNPDYGITLNWVSGDGLPFVITNASEGGNNIVSFKSPLKHGLSIGEFVKLSLTYNNEQYFQVYSLGDFNGNNTDYIFNIFNYGFTGNTFDNGISGTFVRVLDINNTGDTTSKYYVKQIKLLTNVDDAVVTKAGFEQNIFGGSKKYESSGLTPNNIERVSIKEGAQSYNLSFNKDFDISEMRDNQKRPISELFFTVIWKGYFGWTFGIPNGNSGNYYGLKQGYECNLQLINNLPNQWWVNSNPDNRTNFPIGAYITPLGSKPFTYIKSLNKGDIIDGEYCEFNNFEQIERVITPIYHKFTFNPFVFNTKGSQFTSNNLFGYYYEPHHKITIKEYSDYTEDGDIDSVDNVPDYSYFSTLSNTFIWRDLYPYGYIDSNNVGVDYPFVNGKHYPHTNSIFRLIPEGTNFINNTIVTEPTIDGCE